MSSSGALGAARHRTGPSPSAGDSPASPLIEAFVPEGKAEVAESHEVVIDAPADLVLVVAESFDLLSVSTVYAIFPGPGPGTTSSGSGGLEGAGACDEGHGMGGARSTTRIRREAERRSAQGRSLNQIDHSIRGGPP